MQSAGSCSDLPGYVMVCTEHLLDLMVYSSGLIVSPRGEAQGVEALQVRTDFTSVCFISTTIPAAKSINQMESTHLALGMFHK